MINKLLESSLKWVSTIEIIEQNYSEMYDYLYFNHMMFNITKDEKYKKTSIEILEKFPDTIPIYKDKNSTVVYRNSQNIDFILGNAYLKNIYNIESKALNSYIKKLIDEKEIENVTNILKILDIMYEYFMESIGYKFINKNEEYKYSSQFPNWLDEAYVCTHIFMIKTKFFTNEIDKKDIMLQSCEEFLLNNIDKVYSNRFIDLLGEYLMILSFSSNKYINKQYIQSICCYLTKYKESDGSFKCPIYSKRENLHANFAIIIGLTLCSKYFAGEENEKD